ncbi:nuclear transport factor 2 family protein [Pseudonocardia lacus]|uniref:nuclear transport factor 2 family protein n=1 Tax=Pseudonocardia lacus TaxID=2835865 RepID=UPI001BDD59D5|nr:nuclear transport factor 2 family protein [Pseudonocardia lacus]
MKDLVEAYFAAINSDRFADLAAVFAPDVEIHTAGGPPVVGREAALAHFPAVLAGYAAHHDEVTRWILAPDVVVCEIAFSGRLRDGRLVVFDALDVFDAAGAGITRIGTWYDTRAVARQVRAP